MWILSVQKNCMFKERAGGRSPLSGLRSPRLSWRSFLLPASEDHEDVRMIEAHLYGYECHCSGLVSMGKSRISKLNLTDHASLWIVVRELSPVAETQIWNFVHELSQEEFASLKGLDGCRNFRSCYNGWNEIMINGIGAGPAEAAQTTIIAEAIFLHDYSKY